MCIYIYIHIYVVYVFLYYMNILHKCIDVCVHIVESI